LAADSIVNGIDNKAGDKVEIIRLDLISTVGRQTAREFGVAIVPFTLVFDGSGKVVHRRKGLPDAQTIVETIQKL